jgi:hypothetical protein
MLRILQGATCSHLRNHLRRKDDLIHIAPAIMPLALAIGFEVRIFPGSVQEALVDARQTFAFLFGDDRYCAKRK